MKFDYMTDKEHNDWFDRSYEHQREVSAQCYYSIEEQRYQFSSFIKDCLDKKIVNY